MNNSTIKIVYCTDDLYGPGGMQRVLSLKASYLADVLGYDVTICLTEEKGRPLFYPLSSKVHVVNFDINFYRMYDHTPFPLKVLKYKLYMRRYKKMLSQKLIELRPDITVSLLRKDINFINSIKDGSKKIGEIHFDKSNYRIFKGPLPAFICNMISRQWMKQLIKQLRKLDTFVVLTNEDLENWTELNNVICIHNPVSFDNIPVHSSSTSKKVIAIGRYTYQKGIDLLLQAWQKVSQRHPDWELQVFGDGARESYLQLAENLNISHSCHLNPPTNKITDKLIESSIFVLSSRYEGMPMVLGEAMAHGLPPVSFTCPCGPHDIIMDGENGLLVENGNIDQLAEKICYLIEHEDIRKEMGKNAIQNIKRFYIKNIIPYWDELFKKTVK